MIDLSPLFVALEEAEQSRSESLLRSVNPVVEVPPSLYGYRGNIGGDIFAANSASPRTLIGVQQVDVVIEEFDLQVGAGTTAPTLLQLALWDSAGAEINITPQHSPGLSSQRTLSQWLANNSTAFGGYRKLVIPQGFRLMLYFTAGTADVEVIVRSLLTLWEPGLIYPRHTMP